MNLTETQERILQLLIAGHSRAAVRDILGITFRAVADHINNACDAAGAKTDVQLAAMYVRTKVAEANDSPA